MSALGGQRALITGAAAGLGLHTALGLARLGARVLIVDRNVEGGQAAVQQIRAAVPGAVAEFRALDLASLAAIRAFAAALLAEDEPLDILVNNAGLLPPRQRVLTADGFELGFGVSALGHFALTGLLLPLLLRSARARVVAVSSIVHGDGGIDFDNLHMARHYDATRAYANTKLASLLLALELQRRAAAAGSRLMSVAAHPGIARTGIGDSWKAKGPQTLRDRLAAAGLWVATRWLSQSVEQGAESLIHAAAGPDVQGGAFYGPDGFKQFAGAPTRLTPKTKALDAALAQKLWEQAEVLTGVRYAWP